MSKRFVLVMLVSIIVSGTIGFFLTMYLCSEREAEAREYAIISQIDTSDFRDDIVSREKELSKVFDQINSDLENRKIESIEQKAINKKSVRKVRRWEWNSPAKRIARIWNVPRDETITSTIGGLLRICTSEQEGSRVDCIGIWQVLNSIRSKSCNRERISLITECDDDGETMLSVMRRASRHVVGIVPARYTRQKWIAKMEINCDMPEIYPSTIRRFCHRDNECALKHWENNHRCYCESTVELAGALVAGEIRTRLTSANIIAWGGRCEEPGGACDDHIACARGLARAPQIERMGDDSRPANAFWCRRGSPYCRKELDPICYAMGYREDVEDRLVSHRQGG